MKSYMFEGDIGVDEFKALRRSGSVACDSETSGLEWRTEYLGLFQIYNQQVGVVFIRPTNQTPKKLIELLEDESVEKIFHHAMFDLRFAMKRWRFTPRNISCTKIMAKLLDPDAQNTLQGLLKKHLSVEITKREQASDWMSHDLTKRQLRYASNDVLYLADLAKVLRKVLAARDLLELSERCFIHLPTRVELEIRGYPDVYDY